MDPQNPQSENNSTPENVTTPLPSQETTNQSQQVPSPAPQQENAYQQPVTPAAFYQSQAAAQAPVSPSTNSPATIILQWLTYAFWGWTIIAFGVLISTVLSYVIVDAEVGESIPYELAAIIVLLPISLICDYFYSRNEPEKKTGAATIVMVIHAVIFALFGIGSVIFAVFALVRMFVSASDSGGSMVMLASAAIISVVYGAALLRTINPPKFPWIQRGFSLFMIALLVVTAIAAIVGPVLSERSRRNDKLIEENISAVTRSISNYANENDSLPSSLDTLEFSDDAQKLVDSNLLKYTPNSKPAATEKAAGTYSRNTRVFYYTLCANYDKSKENKYDYGNSGVEDKDKDGYTTYITADEHASGEVCYKVTTDYFSY